jgi:RHS repeat-associated protein
MGRQRRRRASTAGRNATPHAGATQYDAAEQRVLLRVNAGAGANEDQRIYVGSGYERQETSETGVPVIRHIYKVQAGGKQVAQVERQEQFGAVVTTGTRYIHSDHLGSSQVVTDESARLVHVQRFDAFGAPASPAAQSSDALAKNIRAGFTGHESDVETGLVNMRGRIYDARIGRFLQADPPFMQTPFWSQGLNRYSYVFNNPLSFVDPSGFASEGDTGTDAEPEDEDLGFEIEDPPPQDPVGDPGGQADDEVDDPGMESGEGAQGGDSDEDDGDDSDVGGGHLGGNEEFEDSDDDNPFGEFEITGTLSPAQRLFARLEAAETFGEYLDAFGEALDDVGEDAFTGTAQAIGCGLLGGSSTCEQNPDAGDQVVGMAVGILSIFGIKGAKPGGGVYRTPAAPPPKGMSLWLWDVPLAVDLS